VVVPFTAELKSVQEETSANSLVSVILVTALILLGIYRSQVRNPQGIELIVCPLGSFACLL
jgi:hypothetical protein